MITALLKKPISISINVVLFLCISLNCHAANLTQMQQEQMLELKKTALTSDLSYQLVESLTTEVGPRLAGTPGDAKAIAWSIKNMKALGFDKVWTEEVVASQWIRGEAHAKILAPYPHNVVALALGGSVGTSNQGISAEIVHFETLADLEAAATNSLKGKIAFISYRMEKHIDGSGYGPAVGARVNGASIAAEKGALALVMRSVGTDNNRIAHTGLMRYKEGINKIPAVAISNPDADLLINQLKRKKPVRFFLKLSASIENKKLMKSANVIGEITGTEFPEQIVAIGAHLDSWDVGTGAVDDGIGIAMTMAAAHHISKLKERPKRTIRVILFAAEEIGLLGAKKYMELHKDNIKNHMIGAEWDFGVGKIYKMTPGVGKKSLSAIRELAEYLAPLGVALSDKNNGSGQSDMSLVTKAGMPAMNFSADGTDYFHYHHTENDTLDKVNPAALKQSTAVYTLFAYFTAASQINFRE